MYHLTFRHLPSTTRSRSGHLSVNRSPYLADLNGKLVVGHDESSKCDDSPLDDNLDRVLGRSIKDHNCATRRLDIAASHRRLAEQDANVSQ
jgi:hypothetical protein